MTSQHTWLFSESLVGNIIWKIWTTKEKNLNPWCIFCSLDKDQPNSSNILFTHVTPHQIRFECLTLCISKLFFLPTGLPTSPNASELNSSLWQLDIEEILDCEGSDGNYANYKQKTPFSSLLIAIHLMNSRLIKRLIVQSFENNEITKAKVQDRETLYGIGQVESVPGSQLRE